MPPRLPPTPNQLTGLARRQDGIVTRTQALAAGVSAVQVDGHLRHRRWARLLPQVYLVERTDPSAMQMIRATALWVGPGAVITGAAALHWQRRRDVPLAEIAIAVPRHVRSPTPSPGSPWRIRPHRSAIGSDWTQTWNGIDVLLIEFVIGELLPVEGPGLLDEAVRRRWVTREQVAHAHQRMPAGRGAAARSAIIAAAAGGANSEAERLLHRLLHAGGIRGWRDNAELWPGAGRRVGDVIFDELKLLLEVDGFAFHTDHRRFQDDRARQNEFVVAGWTVLRFTWWGMQREPERVQAQIRSAIVNLAGHSHANRYLRRSA